MNNNRDVLSGSDLEMPSGFEVEAATFHAPVVAEVVVVTPQRSGSEPKASMMEKLDSLRMQSRMKLHDAQHLMSEKSAVMKSSLQRSMMTAKSQMQQKMMEARSTTNRSMIQAKTSMHTGFNDMQSDMKVNPMKWAGIAAGSGFAIGLIGRYMHWRNNHRQMRGMPQLVIIESAC